jgi:hypothetical protein
MRRRIMVLIAILTAAAQASSCATPGDTRDEGSGETGVAVPSAGGQLLASLPACSDSTAQLLARAVILAAPIVITDQDIYINNGEPLRAFVGQFRAEFAEGGAVARCASLAGRRLVGAGIATYDRNAYDRIISSAPPEIAHLSQDVADRINSPSTDMFELGQELEWLGQVLPAVARDDLGPFTNTGYPLRNNKREQLAAIWPSLQAMCSLGDCREMFLMALPVFRQLIDEVAFGMNYTMILMAGNG